MSTRTSAGRDTAQPPEAAAGRVLGREGWWRTLEERAHDPAFRERLSNEFPSQIEAITDPVARRHFLQLMAASMGLAGMTACTRQPLEKIVPYVRQPEELIPGKPLFFATAMALGGSAIGLLVESHEGRPTKIEGNPLHPSSIGATDVFAQAAILGLYDPDRSQTLTNLGDIRPWSAFLGAIRAAVAAQAALQGAGLRILTESVSSPTLAAQIREVLARYPSARWHQWDPASPENAREVARLAFGQYVTPQYRLAQADVILVFDADVLGCGAGSLAYARDFAARRRPEQPDRMNRLYAVESMPVRARIIVCRRSRAKSKRSRGPLLTRYGRDRLEGRDRQDGWDRRRDRPEGLVGRVGSACGHTEPRTCESSARCQCQFALGARPPPRLPRWGPRVGPQRQCKRACGHTEPRTCESSARCQRQFALGVGPQRQCKKVDQTGLANQAYLLGPVRPDSLRAEADLLRLPSRNGSTPSQRISSRIAAAAS